MSASIMDLVAQAKQAVPAITPDELQGIMDRDDVLIVDVRDHPEVAETGSIPGAIHVTRGMLEFRADEATPFHDKNFSKDKTIVVMCASGGRAALCGKALMDLGYTDVRNLGGFSDWTNSGGAVSTP
jgi:rhodanese-related sulfurtransferase